MKSLAMAGVLKNASKQQVFKGFGKSLMSKDRQSLGFDGNKKRWIVWTWRCDNSTTVGSPSAVNLSFPGISGAPTNFASSYGFAALALSAALFWAFFDSVYFLVSASATKVELMWYPEKETNAIPSVDAPADSNKLRRSSFDIFTESLGINENDL
jgi:hypothetical protein